MHTGEFFETFSFLDSAVGCTPQSFYKFEGLGEIKTEFENT